MIVEEHNVDDALGFAMQYFTVHENWIEVLQHSTSVEGNIENTYKCLYPFCFPHALYGALFPGGISKTCLNS